MSKSKNKNFKVVIDKEKCLGCGSCVALVPEVFQLGKDGKAEVKDPLAASLEQIQLAKEACPVKAIKIEK